MKRYFCAAALAIAMVVGFLWSREPEEAVVPEPASPTSVLPRQVRDGGYVSSSSCRSCHPQQYASWHRTYHRSMTQKATPKAVLAPFDGVRLESRGRSYRFKRTKNDFFVEMIDPHSAGIERKRIVMTTGSHHLQTYWVASGRGNELQHVPWYYHLAEQQWIPSDDSVVAHPDLPYTPVVWNTTCIACHAVHGRPSPGPRTAVLSSDVAELGIACEACHGPGKRHVDQLRKTQHSDRHTDETRDLMVVNPANLSHQASSEICGQCHSLFSAVTPDSFHHGYSFRPGHIKLAASHRLARLEDAPDGLRDSFWGDGTMRVGGREFSAMIESACYKRGKLSCLSCHSMHNSDPNDQLSEHMDTNHSCLQCHSDFSERISAHTHHRPGSSGSLCYNCHMPHTSFALLKAMRSHRIDSPSAANSKRTGRPNACNQCHIDQPLAWTAQHLTEWYGTPEVQLDLDETQIAASALWLLKGDAVQRVVTAWSLSWKPAVETSGDDWQPPLLIQLLDDPYAVVRFVAYQSLRTFTGFENFKYDFVKPPAEAKEKAIEIWRLRRGDPQRVNPERVLVGRKGEPLHAEIRRLMKRRNDRKMHLPE